LLKSSELPPELFRKPNVIGSAESNPVCPRLGYSAVEGDALTLVGLIVVSNAIAERLLKDFAGTVGRAVINDDNLNVRKGLRQYAFHTLLHQ
jgi:hypothetical protein